MLTAHTERDAEQLRAAGVITVLEPFSDAVDATSTMLKSIARGDDQPR